MRVNNIHAAMGLEAGIRAVLCTVPGVRVSRNGPHVMVERRGCADYEVFTYDNNEESFLVETINDEGENNKLVFSYYGSYESIMQDAARIAAEN